MISYRYSTRAILRDYLLSGVGLALFLPPVVFMSLPLVTNLLFAALAGLFLIFGLQSYRRHRTRVELSDDGILIAPAGRALRWRALSKLVLSYFNVRREGSNGWMELKLVSGGQSVRLDSRLEGFTEVAACAARAAQDNGVELDQATVTNLAALGIHAKEAAVSDGDER